MIEPPIPTPDQMGPSPEAQQQGAPEQQAPAREDPTLDNCKAEIRLALVAAAHIDATATTPQEVKDTGQGVLSLAQALVALSPELNPKVYEAEHFPKQAAAPTDQPATKPAKPPQRPQAKAT